MQRKEVTLLCIPTHADAATHIVLLSFSSRVGNGHSKTLVLVLHPSLVTAEMYRYLTDLSSAATTPDMLPEEVLKTKLRVDFFRPVLDRKEIQR